MDKHARERLMMAVALFVLLIMLHLNAALALALTAGDIVVGLATKDQRIIRLSGAALPWRVAVGAILVVVPLLAIAYGLAGWFGVACVIGLFVMLAGMRMIVTGLKAN